MHRIYFQENVAWSKHIMGLSTRCQITIMFVHSFCHIDLIFLWNTCANYTVVHTYNMELNEYSISIAECKTAVTTVLMHWGLGYWEISMLKSMSVNKDFQTWHLIGWQHSCQPIRSHVRKSLLTNMEFNMDFSLLSKLQPWSTAVLH